MNRRNLLSVAAFLTPASLTRPGIAQPDRAHTPRFAPCADLTALDPVWSTADIVRDRGCLNYPTLHGTGDAFQPQVAAGHRLDGDGRRCTATLRRSLSLHDNEPVRARDCVACRQRWTQAAPIGQTPAAILSNAPDDAVAVPALHDEVSVWYAGERLTDAAWAEQHALAMGVG